MHLKKLALSALCFASVLIGQTTGPTVRFVTLYGNIDVVLTPSVAPLTVANFLNYVNTGAYVNTIIHRSVSGFVIQGGGYQYVAGAPVATAANPAVQNEFNVSNTRGTIAMALPSNSPNGATNQWFFNLANNGSQLDGQSFTVFGHIANSTGLSVMDRIAALPVADLSTAYGADFSTVPTGGNSFVVVSAIVPVPSLTANGFQSAASFAESALTGISPGEFLVIYGQSLGPANLTTLTVTNGLVDKTLAGTQVLFNGKAVPVIYTSTGQVSVIAPYSISSLETVNITVTNQGVPSTALVFQVKPANPAIFTLNSSGTGDGAIVRLDGSIVKAASPALVGDILVLYGQGYGATTDATSLPDGMIVGSLLPVPADPITLLFIDGQKVDTLYFGGAPSLVNGVLQVNFKVPTLTPGSHQIQLQVGDRKSPSGVTLQTK